MNKLELLELIIESELFDDFLKIVGKAKNNQIIQDDDELYAGGFWDFTFDLGFNLDNGNDEKQFLKAYYMLWEITNWLLKK